ncbi:unnamed protein product [Phaedon cochleariae]|uniref:Uncharacterized protein n=1 Tax=Phaedon cochleariae TaxID=80249 RepID=A0A9P0DH26_PHACE|nr:unnamed protein product [Phaedon cochleariae]
MKIIATVFIVSAFIALGKCLTEEEKQMMMDVHKECTAVSGITDAMIEQAKTGNFPPDSEFKEHLVCFAKKVGIMSDTGEIQKDVISQMVHMHVADTAKADEIVNKCVLIKATPQDTMFESAKCMFESQKFF